VWLVDLIASRISTWAITDFFHFLPLFFTFFCCFLFFFIAGHLCRLLSVVAPCPLILAFVDRNLPLRAGRYRTEDSYFFTVGFLFYLFFPLFSFYFSPFPHFFSEENCLIFFLSPGPTLNFSHCQTLCFFLWFFCFGCSERSCIGVRHNQWPYVAVFFDGIPLSSIAAWDKSPLKEICASFGGRD